MVALASAGLAAAGALSAGGVTGGAAAGGGLLSGLAAPLVGGVGSGLAGGLVGRGGAPAVSSVTALPDDRKVIITGGTGVNFGQKLLPFEGSSANGGFGVRPSRLISAVGEPIARLAGFSPQSETFGVNNAALIGLALIGGVVFLLVRK